jgi:hypothetical protein
VCLSVYTFQFSLTYFGFPAPFTYFGSPLPISVFPLRLHISVLLYRFRFSCSSACWSPFPSPASEELPVMLALQSEIWGSISFCLPRAYTAHSIRPVVLVLGFVFPLLRSRCASPGSGSDRLFRSQLWVLRIDSISFVLCVNHCREDPGCAIEPPDQKSREFVV